MIAASHRPRRLAAACVAAIGALACLLPQGAAAQERQHDAALALAYNVTGQELLTGFSGKPGNVVFSPFSIGTAMAMVLSGARGDTRRGNGGQVLRHTGPAKRSIAPIAHAALLNGYDRSGAARSCPPGMRLDRRAMRKRAAGRTKCPRDSPIRDERNASRGR